MLVSTLVLGGHVDTIDSPARAGRRRRRLHSDEFKANAVSAAAQPGVSMASVAPSRGINANLLRRWVREAEVLMDRSANATAPATPAFVALQLPAPAAASAPGDIRVEVRRGTTTITIAWPMAAASECATWLREMLR